MVNTRISAANVLKTFLGLKQDPPVGQSFATSYNFTYHFQIVQQHKPQQHIVEYAKPTGSSRLSSHVMIDEYACC